MIDDGVVGFWTDMGEPAWSNEESTDRLFMKHHLGMHNEIHNVYGLTWDKVVTEQFEKRNPTKRIFQMTRSAFAGLQRYTFGWSGDTGDGNNVLDGWKKLENQIPVALSAGMGGIPFWSCDISEYCGDIKDYEAMSELYVRWMQFGVYNPISRAHHEGNNAVEPWLFGPEAEKICKKAIELKYQLFPYIYTYAREAHDTGLPIMRALMLEYPNDPETFNLNSEFLFGKELLVAPVMEQGAVSKKVYLPEGEWYDFNHPQKSYHGKQWIDFPVSLETTPVFVRRGAVIPMMPVMQFINEKTDHPLIIHIFPETVNKKATFDVYEDDGETNNYKQDIFARRNITCKTYSEKYTLQMEQKVSGDFQATSRNLVYQLHLEQCPASVTSEKGKLKKAKLAWAENQKSVAPKAQWSWNEDSKICMVNVPANESLTEIIIKK